MGLITGIGLSASCGKLIVPGKKSMVASSAGAYVSTNFGSSYTYYTTNLGFARGGCVSGDGSTFYFGLANNNARISRDDGANWNTCGAIYSYDLNHMVCSYDGYYACGHTTNNVFSVIGNYGTTNLLNVDTGITEIITIAADDTLSYIYILSSDGVLYKYVNRVYNNTFYLVGTFVSVSPSGQYVVWNNGNNTQFYLSTDYGNTFTAKSTGGVYFSFSSVTNDYIYFKMKDYAQIFKYDLSGNYISSQVMPNAGQYTTNFIVSRDSKYVYFEYGGAVYASADGGANYTVSNAVGQDNQFSINR